MKHFFLIICFNAAFMLSYSSHALQAVTNNGEDVTRPLTRFDLRLKFQDGVNSIYGKDAIVTARTDRVIYLPSHWQVGLRADLPYEWYTCHRCSCGKSLDHFADSLFQALLITPSHDKWTGALGAKIIFPTGGNNLQIGDAKYQLLPTLAIKYDLDDWSPGAYIGLLIRHAFNVGGYKSAPYISQTFIQPFFNLNFPKDWFLSWSPEMIYNWRIKGWFIPTDIMIGKMVTKKIVVSIEYENAIVYEFRQYTQQIEFRVGFFF